MADPHDPVETGMPHTVKIGIIAVLVILVFMWLLPRKATDTAKTATAPKPAAGASDRDAERQLAGILEGLAPERVAITSERIDRLAELSQWAGESLDKGEAATVTVDETANARWFSGDALSKVNDPSFSLRDAHHITLASLAGEMVARVTRKASEPLDQIQDLFRIVVFETSLMPDVYDEQLRGTAFESLLLGRSTAAGRAWAFATLLRQLQIDAVILEPKSKPEAWLIGVIAPSGDVLLYDPRLGTCLPGEAGPSGFDKPATLELVKQKPELLRELDVSSAPYPLAAEDLGSLNVKLITDSSTSSLRMAKLQLKITGGPMEIFDGVGKNSIREKGLADRVIAAGPKGGWTEKDISIWSSPEQQSEAFMSNGAEDSKAWKGINDVFLGPVIITEVRLQTKNESDARTETVVQRTDKPLRRVRVDQLKGNFENALRGYGQIRDAFLLVATRNQEHREKLALAMPLNRKAAEFAIYWIAMCQLEQKPGNVPGTLGTYLRLFPQGEMLSAVPDLWASALAATGDKAGAIKFLEGGQKTPRREILIKQWKAPAAGNDSEAPPATPEKPPGAAQPKTEASPAPPPAT